MRKVLLLGVLILASLVVKSQQTVMVLVRHAEKMADGSKDPGLTTAGQARAVRLKEMLASQEVAAIFSTPYNRTKSTVAPLALDKALVIKEYKPFAEGFLEKLNVEYQGQTVVIVGHSNTIPAMVNQLIGEEKYADLSDMDYGNLFVVTIHSSGEGKEVVLQY